MTPDQLANLATQINNLPPEEQQRLMDAARKLPPHTTYSAAPTSTTADQPATAPAGQPAFGQLQGVAGSSQSAALAPSLESAAAQARQGFDTAGGGVATPGVAISGNTVAPSSPPAAAQPAPTGAAPPPAAHSVAVSPASPATLPNPPKPSGSGSAPVPTTAVATAPGTVAISGAPCPPGVGKIVPSRQVLETELAVRRAQLESLRNTILRLNRTIQLNQQEFAVWEDEADSAITRLNGRIFDLPTKLMFDSFIDSQEDYFKEMPMSDTERADKLRKLALVKNIKDFDDFRKFALEHKTEWETIEEGTRSLVDSLPISKEALSYVHCGEDLIDNAYDYVDLVSTWNNVQQLDHNSTQFLAAVQQNGERMKALVERIQQIQAQLNATPTGPASASPCRATSLQTTTP